RRLSPRLLEEQTMQRVTALERQPKSFRGNRTHLRRLLETIRAEGNDAWNDWRKHHPTVRPDLRGLDLSRDDVDQVNLRGLNLRSARLCGARLTGLRIWNAQLSGADLSHANLDRVDLSYGDLSDANLECCRLVQANLTLVKAERAIFRNANLSHA